MSAAVEIENEKLSPQEKAKLLQESRSREASAQLVLRLLTEVEEEKRTSEERRRKAEEYGAIAVQRHQQLVQAGFQPPGWEETLHEYVEHEQLSHKLAEAQEQAQQLGARMQQTEAALNLLRRTQGDERAQIVHLTENLHQREQEQANLDEEIRNCRASRDSAQAKASSFRELLRRLLKALEDRLHEHDPARLPERNLTLRQAMLQARNRLLLP